MQRIFASQALTPQGWIKDAFVTIDVEGRIETVARDAKVQAAAHAGVHRVGTLLPAPANLHSHAFQRAMAGMTERRGPEGADSFWTWRRLMYRFLDQLTPEDCASIAALVQVEMMEAGYAAVGEFHYLHHQPDGSAYDDPAEMAAGIAQAASETGIGLTLLPVLYEVGGCDGRDLTQGQVRFGSKSMDDYAALLDASRAHLSALPPDAGIGVAPHSLRAVTPSGVAEAAALAGEGPVHIHISEQMAEVEEVREAWGARPVEWLLTNADVSSRWCLIHLTHMTEEEVAGVARSEAVAGLCPITESSLGDGIFEGVSFTAANGRFGVGSDSNIRISLSEELRTLEYSQRLKHHGRAMLADEARSTGRALFESAAHGGAQALRRASGAIAPGFWADLVALDDDDAKGSLNLMGKAGDGTLDAFIFAGDDRVVRDVWAAGRRMVCEGRHIARDVVETRYRSTIRRLQEAM